MSDVIGNNDVIRNGENGFVCKDVEEFMGTIQSRGTDRLISASFEDIKTQYNTVVMADEYAKIYRGDTEYVSLSVPVVVYKCVDTTAEEAVAA